tara:strand:- start:151 stop:441 length:291 start_codon:yes stop_codon:yes gene_type:complete
MTLINSGNATNGAVTAGVASVEVLAANNQRVGYAIVNDSDTAVYLAFGATAVLNEGVRLNSNGGATVSDTNSIFTGAINVISSAGSKEVTFVEFTQ